MASNRHLGRIITLQSLYEYECRTKAGDATADIDSIIAKNIEPYSKALGDTEFVYQLARGVSANFEPLDEALRPLAPEWPIDSIAPIDRNVLRIGLYELTRGNVPPKVAINEAVELAKAFGSDNSSRFINGVLGTAYRQLSEETGEANSDNKEASAGKGATTDSEGATTDSKATSAGGKAASNGNKATSNGGKTTPASDQAGQTTPTNDQATPANGQATPANGQVTPADANSTTSDATTEGDATSAL